MTAYVSMMRLIAAAAWVTAGWAMVSGSTSAIVSRETSHRPMLPQSGL